MKSCQFSEQNSAKLVGYVKSFGPLSHFVMVKQASYVYEKFAMGSIFTLEGLVQSVLLHILFLGLFAPAC